MFSKSDRNLFKQILAAASIATSKASLLHDSSVLTPNLLKKMGWQKADGFYFDKYLKKECAIYVKFDGPVYRVYFGKDVTFINEKSGTHWFFMFLLLVLDETAYEFYMKKIFENDKPRPADPGNN